jgi:hypothetical protein
MYRMPPPAAHRSPTHHLPHQHGARHRRILTTHVTPERPARTWPLQHVTRVVSGRRQYDRRAMPEYECIGHGDKAASRLPPKGDDGHSAGARALI